MTLRVPERESVSAFSVASLLLPRLAQLLARGNERP